LLLFVFDLPVQYVQHAECTVAHRPVMPYWVTSPEGFACQELFRPVTGCG
jgi:hypothetical protein